MKKFLTDIFVLGGAYLILSVLVAFVDKNGLYSLDSSLSLALIVLIIVRIFSKPFSLIEKFKSKFPIISLYLASIGWTAFIFNPISFVMGIISGYQVEKAAYNNVKLNAVPLWEEFVAVQYAQWTMIICSLLIATGTILYKRKRS